jgi:hypothetical protein
MLVACPISLALRIDEQAARQPRQPGRLSSESFTASQLSSLNQSGDVNALLIDQRSPDQAKIVNQKHHCEKCVVTRVPGRGSDKAKHEPQAMVVKYAGP